MADGEGEDWISTSPILLAQPLRAREYTPGRALTKQEARDARRRGGAGELSKLPTFSFAQRPLLGDTHGTDKRSSGSPLRTAQDSSSIEANPQGQKQAKESLETRKTSPQKSLARSPAKPRNDEVQPASAARASASASSGTKGKGRANPAVLYEDTANLHEEEPSTQPISPTKGKQNGTASKPTGKRLPEGLLTVVEEEISLETAAAEEHDSQDGDGSGGESSISRTNLNGNIQPDGVKSKEKKSKSMQLPKAKPAARKQQKDLNEQSSKTGKRKLQEVEQESLTAQEASKKRKGKGNNAGEPTKEKGGKRVPENLESPRLQKPKPQKKRKVDDSGTTEASGSVLAGLSADASAKPTIAVNETAVKAAKKSKQKVRTVTAAELFEASWQAVLQVLNARRHTGSQAKRLRKLEGLAKARQESKALKLQGLASTKERRQAARHELDKLDGKRRALAVKMKQEETRWHAGRANLEVTLALHDTALRLQHERLDADDGLTASPEDLESLLHTVRRLVTRSTIMISSS